MFRTKRGGPAPRRLPVRHGAVHLRPERRRRDGLRQRTLRIRLLPRGSSGIMQFGSGKFYFSLIVSATKKSYEIKFCCVFL
jgi:hypothetical protein